MSDYLTITSDIRNPDGTPANGTLYVLLTARLVLAGGGQLAPNRYAFNVVDGVAKKPDGSTMQLAITEDANPQDTTYYLSFLDGFGRKQPLGELAVPRETGPATLGELLPVGMV